MKFSSISLGILLSLAISASVIAQTTSNECEGPSYGAKEVSKRAKITSFPPPKLSTSKVRRPVVLKVILCRTGKVTNIELVEKFPEEVTKGVIKAARQVRFIPAEKDGERVSQKMIFEYVIN